MRLNDLYITVIITVIVRLSEKTILPVTPPHIR